MDNNELKHHGIKGQQWGVRRTPKQLAAARNKRTTDQLNAYRSIANDSSNAFRNASNVANTVGNNVKPSRKARKEASQMSDNELRARINRMNLESQYASMHPSRTAKGAAFAKGFLDVAGSITAIGASALGIALAVKQLKG